MRRAHGPRAAITLETYALLAQLYTSTAQSYQANEKTGSLAQAYFKKAVGVHEDVLRLLVRDEDEEGDAYDSDDDMDSAAALLAREGVSVAGSSDRKSTRLNSSHWE